MRRFNQNALAFFKIGAFLFLASCSVIEARSPHLNVHKDGYVADDRGQPLEIPAVKKVRRPDKELHNPPFIVTDKGCSTRQNEIEEKCKKAKARDEAGYVGDVNSCPTRLRLAIEQQCETAEEFEVYKLIKQISKKVDSDCNRSGKRKTHLMLFVHGGLTSIRSAMRQSVKLDRSEVFEKLEIRPIYINWNSSLWSTIGDDVFWVRGGQRTIEGLVVTPVIVAWRLSIGLINALPIWWYQIVDETRFYQDWPAEPIPTAVDIARDGAIGVVHSPFSIVSAPLLTGFGRGGWEMMKRRVDMMFTVMKGPKRFGFRNNDPYPGVMRTFLEELSDKQSGWEDICTDGFKLDFVGHSMGVLVGTRILREFPSLKLNRIIFLAAASTVEEYVTTIPPYLDIQKNSTFYNLNLSVIDEGNELTLKSSLLPRGSLLVWIDNFLDPILSPEDFRLGDSFNESLFGFPLDKGDSRCNRMSMVKFVPVDDKKENWPSKHGEFNDSKYVDNLLRLLRNADTDNDKHHIHLVNDCKGVCAVFSPCAQCYIKENGKCIEADDRKSKGS